MIVDKYTNKNVFLAFLMTICLKNRCFLYQFCVLFVGGVGGGGVL